MPRPRLVVIGHSHVAALARASRTSRDAAVEIILVRLRGLGAAAREDAGIEAEIGSALAQPHDAVVSMIGGNRHNLLGLVQHAEPFDLVLPGHEALPLDPGAALIPQALLRRRMEGLIRPHLDLLAGLRRRAPGRMLHLAPPPPVPSEAHIRANPGIFHDEIAARGVSPPLLRYKLWLLHEAIIAEACAAQGIEHVPPPPEMCDAQGMLVEPAWNPDPTHANALYGASLLRQLARLCGGG